MVKYLKSLFNENFILILFILIIFKTAFILTDFNIFFDYTLYISIILFAYFNKNLFLKANSKNIAKIWFLLFLLQIIGLLQICNITSFKNIISTLIVFLLIIILFNYKLNIKYWIFVMLYSFVSFVLLIMTFDNVWLKNTVPAIFLFLSAAFVVMSLFYYKYTSNCIYLSFCMLSIFLTGYLSYVHHCRTALFTLLIILSSFIILKFFKFKQLALEYLFFIIFGIAFIVIYFYANIRDFYFYDYFNNYMFELFGKNIDSSRSYLWNESLKILSDWQYLLGMGTGKLPEVERYKSSSFHNSYIQLIMQNGLLGLMVLMMLFRKLWNLVIRTQIDDIVYLQ